MNKAEVCAPPFARSAIESLEVHGVVQSGVQAPGREVNCSEQTSPKQRHVRGVAIRAGE
jgi:hypothetical protein